MRDISRRCYLKHKQRYDQANKNWYVNNPKSYLMVCAKRRAKQRNIEFDISLEDFDLPELCPILKIPMVKGTRYAPSLDRINPEKGYIRGNVQVCSVKANTMKNNATPEELRKFAEWVLKSY